MPKHESKKPRVDPSVAAPATRKTDNDAPLPSAGQDKAKASIPYTAAMDILLLGEADFSFSASLARRLGSGARLVCTAFDPEPQHPAAGTTSEDDDDSSAAAIAVEAADHSDREREREGNADKRTLANCAALKAMGATVLHGIDATRLQHAILPGDIERPVEDSDTETAVVDARAFDFYEGDAPPAGRVQQQEADNNNDDDDEPDSVSRSANGRGSGHTRRKQRDPEDNSHRVTVRQFDRVIFLFPHTGVEFSQESGYTESIQSNQDLLYNFFRAAACRLRRPNGQIHVVLKITEPYFSWDIATQAKKSGKLRLKTCIPFDEQCYPGYRHQKTNLVRTVVSDPRLLELVESDPARGLKRTHEQRKDDASDDDDESDDDDDDDNNNETPAHQDGRIAVEQRATEVRTDLVSVIYIFCINDGKNPPLPPLLVHVLRGANSIPASAFKGEREFADHRKQQAHVERKQTERQLQAAGLMKRAAPQGRKNKRR
ncbi:hypothetical protein CAOG_02572 [Capsaspora owczarzaki ATCC 30864]|uniref:25S rRNA (uridine-N(3))-methyltransferase BMT5-like domain-containing protein n=1 Tax=Capsaspora owczarzaki (strain ATCC 30864) TaxID=595528 RepID=A0A0D2WML2_CAPO3|nr:hypothetical protein CAOG_02572 [Capsaspora owczarzaki ATCC 30864]KJE91438.1 hypothetical protein CAOG_002572 [Capsaspora owczarzaki ATCC 30864]|eukprot:XP_004349322.1 hypothetical protein CAOG_02572 [Capsaspora owczarzaki ATCC 30864]